MKRLKPRTGKPWRITKGNSTRVSAATDTHTDKYRDNPHYEDCRYFCHHYDQNAFDPAYPSKPLDFFVPMLRRVFRADPGHLELAETAGEKVA